MRQLSFVVKASGGLLLFAVAPAYCIYALATGQQQGTLRKPTNVIASLESSFGGGGSGSR